jgi:hypothetical protein
LFASQHDFENDETIYGGKAGDFEINQGPQRYTPSFQISS